MSEPGSYEYELARAVSQDRAPKTQRLDFVLPEDIASKISYDDLRQLVTLGAAMLATGMPVRILLRRLCYWRGDGTTAPLSILRRRGRPVDR